jgi:hypothetical protein
MISAMDAASAPLCSNTYAQRGRERGDGAGGKVHLLSARRARVDKNIRGTARPHSASP